MIPQLVVGFCEVALASRGRYVMLCLEGMNRIVYGREHLNRDGDAIGKLFDIDTLMVSNISMAAIDDRCERKTRKDTIRRI